MGYNLRNRAAGSSMAGVRRHSLKLVCRFRGFGYISRLRGGIMTPFCPVSKTSIFIFEKAHFRKILKFSILDTLIFGKFLVL